MKIKLKNLELNYEFHLAESDPKGNILVLHGFTGSGSDWDFAVPTLKEYFNIFTLDLIGHGLSDSPDNQNLYTMESIISQIDEFINKVITNKLIILGYSMGGRIALSYAVKFFGKISGLILESSTWGIKETDLREKRIENDEKKAELILSSDMNNFIKFWMDQDIFDSQKNLPAELIEKISNKKSLNNKTGLANSLRGSGTGRMVYLREQINKLRFPVLLITGQLDNKFCRINSDMLKYLNNAKHVIIPEAGHNIHLEKPDLFLNVINDFLINLNFF